MAAAVKSRTPRYRLEVKALPVPGDDHLAHPFFAEQGRHGLERPRLAVHDEGPANRSAQSSNPGAKLAAIGVGRVAADRRHLGPSFDLLAQDADLLLSLLESPSQGVLGLKSDEE